MKPRRFNSYMCTPNHAWAARVLNMEPNRGKGPDIIDTCKKVEIKFSLKEENPSHIYSWTVSDHQLAYNGKTPCYWGLGMYELECPIRNIRTTDPEKLEELVVSRDLYIVRWDWMNQFPSSPSRGSTDKTVWNNMLRYPSSKHLPVTIKEIEVDKGKVYLTHGVNEELFETICTAEVPF
ncbi:hypothetical protein KW805_01845 [Candidatus Pacearchaeota archaeon]|nr:hypothetical protein [Candidatus Pacearchaeota archaeon]